MAQCLVAASCYVLQAEHAFLLHLARQAAASADRSATEAALRQHPMAQFNKTTVSERQKAMADTVQCIRCSFRVCRAK